MINGKKVIALYMAREGSTRIPDKCIKPFCGKPLLEYCIDKYKSDYIDNYILSTSSEKYIEMYKKKIEIIKRPDYLSKDGVVNLEVYKSVVSCIIEYYMYAPSDYLIHIDITKPLTPVSRIDNFIEVTDMAGFSSILPVKRIQRTFICDVPSILQDADIKYYHFNAFRIFKLQSILDGSFDSPKLSGRWGAGDNPGRQVVNDWEIDLDYEYDWIMAEALAEKGYGS